MTGCDHKKLREQNNRVSLQGKNVLVVGGTGGIGAGAAIRFAQLGASVTIAGRNQQNGAEMVEKMKAASPAAAQFYYLPVDITVMADVKRFAREYMELNKEGLSILVVTSGGLNVGPRRDTTEGIEHNFAISYLGRFLVINKLLPLLLRAPDGARVMSVLSAGHGGPISDLDDIEMKKPGAYSKVKSASYNSILNDFMVDELAAQCKDKNIAFFHLAPGAVATDILKNNNVMGASLMTPVFGWLATSPEDYAEVIAHVAISPEFVPAQSGYLLDKKAQPASRHKFLSQPGAREQVWNYSVETSGLNRD